MPSGQAPLFDPDDLPATPPNRSLVIRPTRGRPLTREERAFNRALARVQALGRRLDDEKRRLDRLLVFHAAEIRPRAERARGLRAELVRALVPFLDDRRLTKAQRHLVRQILIDQLDDVLAQVEKPDPDLQALFERLHDISYTQALQDDLEEARLGMADVLNELGLDLDVPELHADMSEADLAALAAQLADDLGRAEERRLAAEGARSRTKRELKSEEQSRRRERMERDTLGAVYKRLVRELHPDLEMDPAAREGKGRIMQDVTAAYARADLHALLRLELEWIDGMGPDAARLSVEKLRAYTALLQHQATDLQAEIQAVRLHPRYAPLIVDGPFELPIVIDGPGEAQRLDAITEQVRSALTRLTSGDALDEVRGAIREYRRARSAKPIRPRP